MTKKHFTRAAAIVTALRTKYDAGSNGANPAPVVAAAFITLFVEYNPRFDRARFLAACGLVEE
jgi:hypothetical protein